MSGVWAPAKSITRLPHVDLTSFASKEKRDTWVAFAVLVADILDKRKKQTLPAANSHVLEDTDSVPVIFGSHSESPRRLSSSHLRVHAKPMQIYMFGEIRTHSPMKNPCVFELIRFTNVIVMERNNKAFLRNEGQITPSPWSHFNTKRRIFPPAPAHQ